MTSLGDLPPACWCIIADELTAVKKGPKKKSHLADLVQCRIASKLLNNLLNDEFVLSILQSIEDINDRSSHFNCCHPMILLNFYYSHIVVSYNPIPAFYDFSLNESDILIYRAITQLLIKYCDLAFVFKTISIFLLFAVQHADLQFIQQYTQLTIHNRPIVFTSKNIIKACEIAVAKHDPKLSSFVFKCLLSFFNITNGEHVKTLFDALDAGRNIENASLLLILQKKLAANNKPTLNSEILLSLFESDANKLIIPEGRLIDVVQQDNPRAYKSAEINYLVSGNTIKYMTNKAVEKSIEISVTPDGTMTYKGFSTKNHYELICRTSLFEEIFGTFPNHYVALTEHVVYKVPPEQHPWFFGNISNDEVEAKLMGAANRRTFLTRSVGAQIWLQWSVPKRGARQTISHTVYSPNQLVYHKKFALGLHNGGVVKDLHVWQFYTLVCEGELGPVTAFAEQHHIDLTSPEFQFPSPLGELLRNYKKRCMPLVHWLLDHNVSLDPREKLLALALKLQLAPLVDRLLDRGVKCDTDSLKTIILRKPTVETFTKFWACFKPSPAAVSVLIQTILEKLDLWAKEQVHQKKVLTMLAFKYGNEDNCFKRLPKELVQYIISLGVDKPTWWQMAEVMLHSVAAPVSIHFSFMLMKPLGCMEFVWENMDKFTVATHNTFLRLLFINSDEMYLPANIDKLTYWVAKLLRCMKPPLPTLEDPLFMPYLLQHCVQHSLPLLKLLIETKVVSTHYLMQVPMLDKANVPAAWLAVGAGNKQIVKFLVELDAMPLTVNGKALEQYAATRNHSDMMTFIETCKNQR